MTHLHVAKAEPKEQVAGLSLLLTNQFAERDIPAQIERLKALEQSGETSFEHLYLARRDGPITGVTWANITAGRCAAVWPAALIPGEGESTASLLHSFLETDVVSKRVQLLQATTSKNNTIAAKRLLNNGFVQAAKVRYLMRSTASVKETSLPNQLACEPYRESDRLRLKDIIRTTYRNSLDCPLLNGRRKIEDIIDGYCQLGQSGSELWKIVQFANQDIGCLLLADNPSQSQWDLVYMGLAPEWRGRNWGRLLLRSALWDARCAGRKRLVLAVDELNWPALHIYGDEGFEVWDERFAFLKFLH